MARKPLWEWILGLGPEPSSCDVLELAFYGVSTLGYQTYYDESDVQSEVVKLGSLVMVGRQPERGDWAEFLDGAGGGIADCCRNHGDRRHRRGLVGHHG
ncbi:hypothetical protein [Corynebacterium sp. CCM 9204]|uniref:hypothetical protein n=1 Tax=Corynebacterium sp. CCM 9204 TaxID=3057616 RepID=UPI003523DF7F